jgi:hypothetical protein
VGWWWGVVVVWCIVVVWWRVEYWRVSAATMLLSLWLHATAHIMVAWCCQSCH